jgi:Pseudouridylate synthase
MRLFIKLSYNGRNYNGWQVQPGHPSVQETLERALTIWFKEKIQVTGAGRTDTGVSAVNYIAHFDLSSDTLHCLKSHRERFSKLMPFFQLT